MSELEVSEANQGEFGVGGSAHLCQMQQDVQEEEEAKETVPWGGESWCPQSLTLRMVRDKADGKGLSRKGEVSGHCA